MSTPHAVANTAWISALSASLAALWAWVTSIWNWITSVAMTAFTAFQTWATPIITWLQGTVGWILNMYNTWVKPYLEWAINAINTLTNTVKVIRAVLERRIDIVFEALFGEVIKLRDALREGLTNLGSLVHIMNKELGNSIIKMGLELNFAIIEVAQNVRSELLLKIAQVFDPLQMALNEVQAVIRNITRQFTDTIGKIERLIHPTIERPGVIKKEAYVYTGSAYGPELWREIFQDRNPSLTIDEEREYLPPLREDIIGRTIKEMWELQLGPWLYVSEAIQDFAKKALWGEEILKE